MWIERPWRVFFWLKNIIAFFFIVIFDTFHISHRWQKQYFLPKWLQNFAVHKGTRFYYITYELQGLGRHFWLTNTIAFLFVAIFGTFHILQSWQKQYFLPKWLHIFAVHIGTRSYYITYRLQGLGGYFWLTNIIAFLKSLNLRKTQEMSNIPSHCYEHALISITGPWYPVTWLMQLIRTITHYVWLMLTDCCIRNDTECCGLL